VGGKKVNKERKERPIPLLKRVNLALKNPTTKQLKVDF
jgi:hypothetical protein